MYLCLFLIGSLGSYLFYDNVYICVCVCHFLTGILGIIPVEERFLMQVNGMNRFLAMRNQVGRVTSHIYEVMLRDTPVE